MLRLQDEAEVSVEWVCRDHSWFTEAVTLHDATLRIQTVQTSGEWPERDPERLLGAAQPRAERPRR